MIKAQNKGKFAVDIEFDLCGNCGTCAAVCPENVLHLGTTALVADNDECTGCNYCIISCPTDALKLIKRGERADA